MTDLSTFKFWGVKEDGTRDLVGMCNAASISDALTRLPITGKTLAVYDKIEIVKDGQHIRDVR